MKTKVEIPSPLRQYCSGESELQVVAATPQTVLDRLADSHPQLYRCVCNETGRVRPHVNLFVNSKLVRSDAELATPLKTGDVVGIFQAVSGG